MISRARPLLGTIVEVRIAAPDDEPARRAIDAAFAAVERVHALMSFHDPASDLSRLNREAHRAAQRVHPWTHRVLRTALDLHHASGGRFDPAVAPRLVARGLLPRPAGAPEPDPEACCADVELLDGVHVRYRRPLWLDLGGIAKGFAVDAAIATLRAHRVRQGSVNAGGDLRVFGARAQSILVRDPAHPARAREAGMLANGACATSAGYFDPAGEDAWALEDPMRGDRRYGGSITVVAPRCMIADALTKIVALAGSAAAPLLDRHRAIAIAS